MSLHKDIRFVYRFGPARATNGRGLIAFVTPQWYLPSGQLILSNDPIFFQKNDPLFFPSCCLNFITGGSFSDPTSLGHEIHNFVNQRLHFLRVCGCLWRVAFGQVLRRSGALTRQLFVRVCFSRIWAASPRDHQKQKCTHTGSYIAFPPCN